MKIAIEQGAVENNALISGETNAGIRNIPRVK